MLGHPGRRYGCSVRQVLGLGCPGHWAECSAALLLSTPFELSMPVPGQPNPLDLNKARRYTHRELSWWFEQWVDVQSCPVDAHFFQGKVLLWCMCITHWPGSCWCWKDCIHCCWLKGHCGQGCPPWSHITLLWIQAWKYPDQLDLDLQPRRLICRHDKRFTGLCPLTVHLSYIK